uniref:Uncharacterized protein n=1 Tax=Desulfobacca acetoxidans TaxID=60893 RepID=A0A7V4G8W3_9BACT
MSKILTGLLSSTAALFPAEERLMPAHGCPESGAHRQIPGKTAPKVKALKQDYQSWKVGLTLEMMKFPEDWVPQPLRGTDRK